MSESAKRAKIEAAESTASSSSSSSRTTTNTQMAAAATQSSSSSTQQQQQQQQKYTSIVTPLLMGDKDPAPFHYEELNIIGTGAYGTVYRARDNLTGKIVAIKKVRIPLTDNGVPMSTLREIALLKQLNSSDHPNIVKLFDVCQFLQGDGQLVILLIFEHLEQDLSDLIESLPKSGMSPTTIQRLSRELLIGVDFLHSHRIIHRDLKPQNLLISSQGHLKIADFGLAKTYDFEMKLTSVVVTLWYRAPEVLLSQGYNSSVDIWSAACIIAEMFHQKALFPGTSDKNQLDRIFELTGRPSAQEWPKTITIAREHFQLRHPKKPIDLCPNLCQYSNDLLSKMLSFDMRLRPSAMACLEHEYFRQEPL